MNQKNANEKTVQTKVLDFTGKPPRSSLKIILVERLALTAGRESNARAIVGQKLFRAFSITSAVVEKRQRAALLKIQATEQILGNPAR